MTKALSVSLLLLATALQAHAYFEDIPLQTCDRLPVVQVSVSRMQFFFLLDTAATSMLNLQSFAHGDARKIAVTSWSGTVETSAQEITLADLAIGEHHIRSLKLAAIDLSSIGRACGRQIDGILGIDLLSRLGVTIDLKNKTAHLSSEIQDAEARIAELDQQLIGCEAAFNRVDEAAFAECLSPAAVVFTAAGDYYGREANMEYYRRRYFQHDPPAHLSITPRAHHAIGDAVWIEYDLRVTLEPQIIVARGTALCEKSEGRWRIVYMKHSSPADALEAKNQD